MPLEFTFDMKGQRGSMTRTRWTTWVPAGPKEKREKAFDCEEAGDADCIHGQGISIFARDKPRLCISLR